MKDSKAKDAILRHLSSKVDGKQIRWANTEDLSSRLSIEWSQAYTVCEEMQLRGHVQTKSIATVGHPKSLSVGILPAGEHFEKTIGYVKEQKRKNLKGFPENYWWIIAIFTFLVGLFSDIGKDWVKGKINSEQRKPQDTIQLKQDIQVSIDTSGIHKKTP